MCTGNICFRAYLGLSRERAAEPVQYSYAEVINAQMLLFGASKQVASGTVVVCGSYAYCMVILLWEGHSSGTVSLLFLAARQIVKSLPHLHT